MDLDKAGKTDNSFLTQLELKCLLIRYWTFFIIILLIIVFSPIWHRFIRGYNYVGASSQYARPAIVSQLLLFFCSLR